MSRRVTTPLAKLLKNSNQDIHKRKGPFTIIVEGNISSGKTSFLRHFQHHESVKTLTEPIDLWNNVSGYNLTDLMYKDPAKWGFTFQTYVQLTMLKLHEQVSDKPIKMMERSIYSARYCFVENLSRQGLMADAQKVVLDEWFQWITSRKQVACDLIIYLRASPEVVYQRMLKRARSEEEHVSLGYLKTLHDLHEDWLFRKTNFSCPAPVLVLDANQGLSGMATEYRNCEEQIIESSVQCCGSVTS